MSQILPFSFHVFHELFLLFESTRSNVFAIENRLVLFAVETQSASICIPVKPMSILSVANADSAGAVGRQAAHHIRWDTTEGNFGFVWLIHIDGWLKTTPVGLVLDQPQAFR